MSAPYLLDPLSYQFPSPYKALNDPNGLLAIGGDLSSKRLYAAYQQGIFPWFNDDQPILWWSPSPRAVLYPERLKISRSLRKTLNKHYFTVSFDTAFTQVIESCAKVQRKDQHGTWINAAMRSAYIDLHRQGISHSIETWHNGKLVGGLYGLAIGCIFFGESMFSTMNDASKVALVYLVDLLQQWQYELIDCQVSTAHLLRLGAEEISRTRFLQHLSKSCAINTSHAWKK